MTTKRASEAFSMAEKVKQIEIYKFANKIKELVSVLVARVC